MRMGIEVPVGGIIKVYGSEVVCVEDYRDEYEHEVGCSACPMSGRYPCEHLACGFAMRSDGKGVHFEYYYPKNE